MREVSCKTLILEAWIVTFGESLVENARRSFWKLKLSLVVEVSWKMLVLEAWILTFGESLVEMLVLPLLVKVSWKMLVFEAWIVTFGENARFGSLDCHFW